MQRAEIYVDLTGRIFTVWVRLRGFLFGLDVVIWPGISQSAYKKLHSGLVFIMVRVVASLHDPPAHYVYRAVFPGVNKTISHTLGKRLEKLGFCTIILGRLTTWQSHCATLLIYKYDSRTLCLVLDSFLGTIYLYLLLTSYRTLAPQQTCITLIGHNRKYIARSQDITHPSSQTQPIRVQVFSSP